MGGFSCLAVDTSAAGCSLAACHGERSATIDLPADAEPSRHVYLKIHELLETLELPLSGLDCVAFGCGPGAFTGLRVGASVAQALAFALELPVCRVSSLAALACEVETDGPALVAVCTDARMGELYSGLYERGPTGLRPLRSDRLLAPGELELPAAGRILAAGSGWQAYPELRRRFDARIDACDPSACARASGVLALAAVDFSAGRTVAASAALPNYLRDRVTG